MKLRVFLVLLGTSISGFLYGQTPRQTVTQFADWFSFTSSMKASKRLSLLVDIQSRFVNGIDPMQNQIRVGADIKVSDVFSVLPVGYVFTWNYYYGEQPATFLNNEHRIFQQFVFKHKVGKSSFHHRLRTEQRFIQRHTMQSDGTVVDQGFVNKQFRIRYRAYWSMPITEQANPGAGGIDAKSWYVVVYDEFFMSWGESVTYHEIDQNRIFVGLGYQFTKDFTIQSGPFYQILIKANGAQQENNIGIGTWLTYNLDFTK